ncbi:MAG: caspase family protein [Bacteroidia bacterium]
MKYFYLIISILLTNEVYSQAVSGLSNTITISKTELNSEKVRRIAEARYNEWINTRLNESESTSAYSTRVSDPVQQKAAKERIISESIIEVGNIKKELDNINLEYDDENFTLQVKFGKLPPIYISVPNEEFESFLNNKDNLGKHGLKMAMKGQDFFITELVLSNPESGHEYAYNYRNSSNLKFQNLAVNVSSIEDEMLNTAPISSQPKLTTKSVGNSDIDIEIPSGKKRFNNGIAILIGNKNYTEVKGVEFAHNDVNTMKNYLINSLGFEPENIKVELDATKGSFMKLFDVDGWLSKRTKQNSTVFIYYSGHGIPGNNDAKQYFMPVDGDPNYVEKTSYSFVEFYDNLSKLPTKEVLVAVDACFSGYELIDDAKRPGLMRLEQATNRPNNTLVFAASSAKETSMCDKEKKHGLFTYFLLKAIKDRYNSDLNKDNKLTAEEIFQYMSDDQKGIPFRARSLDSVQTPELNGPQNLKSLVLFEY